MKKLLLATTALVCVCSFNYTVAACLPSDIWRMSDAGMSRVDIESICSGMAPEEHNDTGRWTEDSYDEEEQPSQGSTSWSQGEMHSGTSTDDEAQELVLQFHEATRQFDAERAIEFMEFPFLFENKRIASSDQWREFMERGSNEVRSGRAKIDDDWLKVESTASVGVFKIEHPKYRKRVVELQQMLGLSEDDIIVSGQLYNAGSWKPRWPDPILFVFKRLEDSIRLVSVQ